MADALRRLTNTSPFMILHEKLESWQKEYPVSSCDHNLNRCCELIELTAKIQGELFSLLNLTVREGGHYSGVDTIKTRLLPWLGTCFSMGRPSAVSDDTTLQLIQDSVEKDRQIRELSDVHESDMQEMDSQLCSTRLQLDSVRAELDDAQKKLDQTKTKSATTLLATEEEILQLKSDLKSALNQVGMYKAKVDALELCMHQTRLLKDEVSYLTKEKAMLQERLVRSPSPSPIRCESPTKVQITNSSRHAHLLSCFSDLFTIERPEAQILLQRYIDDLEMVQKIIFTAVVESFKTAKLAYRQFKLRVRTTMSTSPFVPESLEDAAMDYIVRNLDLYDVQSSVNDVISAMNVNPQISFPSEVDFVVIGSLIKETCRVAFGMQTLDPPLDLAFAVDGELYNEERYRRSYDSDATAPLVMYHVWPALMEGNNVIAKGEALTRRGALWKDSQNRSRCSSPVRSRSLSPTRTLAFNSRRSLSPGRLRASHL